MKSTEAVRLSKLGKTPTYISRKLKISESWVYRCVQRDKIKSEIKPRNFQVSKFGRKTKISKKVIRFMKKSIRTRKFGSVRRLHSNLQSRNVDISQTTVYNVLKRMGLRSVMPIRKPKLSDENKKQRLKFVHDQLQQDIDFCEYIAFQDEAMFTIGARGKAKWINVNEKIPIRSTGNFYI